MNVYCTECQREQDENKFYKRFIIPKVYEENHKEFLLLQGICKDCLIKKFTHTYKLFNNNFEKTLRAMCEDYNLPFVYSLVYTHTNFGFIDRLNYYIKDITSLKQYFNMNYSESISKKEKSDIDFINDDIKQLKNNIEKSIQKEDFNAHNKWMNSLRDAIELRDKLQGNKNYTINIGTINSNTSDAEELVANLIKLAKENSSICK